MPTSSLPQARELGTLESSYNRLIRAHPLLEKEEELEYCRMALNGDEEARHFVVNSNLRCVMKLAFSYAPRNQEDRKDLIEAGKLALYMILDPEYHKAFDPDLGNKLITYAKYYVRSGMQKRLPAILGIIKVPVNFYVKNNRYKEMVKRYELELERLPTDDEIRKKLGPTTDEEIQMLRNPLEFTSLDESREDFDRTQGQHEILRDEAAVSPEEALVISDRVEYCKRILSTLPEREQEIIKAQFEIGKVTHKTYKALGRIIGVTTTRAGQLKQKALKSLREESLRQGVHESF